MLSVLINKQPRKMNYEKKKIMFDIRNLNFVKYKIYLLNYLL